MLKQKQAWKILGDPADFTFQKVLSAWVFNAHRGKDYISVNGGKIMYYKWEKTKEADLSKAGWGRIIPQYSYKIFLVGSLSGD